MEALAEFVFEIQEAAYIYHPLTSEYMSVRNGSDGALYGDASFDPFQVKHKRVCLKDARSRTLLST